MTRTHGLLTLAALMSTSLQAKAPKATYTIPASETLAEPHTFPMESAEMRFEQQALQIRFAFPDGYTSSSEEFVLSGPVEGNKASITGPNAEAICNLAKAAVDCVITFQTLDRDIFLQNDSDGQPVGILSFHLTSSSGPGHSY